MRSFTIDEMVYRYLSKFETVFESQHFEVFVFVGY